MRKAFGNAKWKELCILTTYRSAVLRWGEAGRRNSSAVLLAILIEVRSLCAFLAANTGFCPRECLIKCLENWSFFPLWGIKPENKKWKKKKKKPKMSSQQTYMLFCLSICSNKELITYQKCTLHCESALSVSNIFLTHS